MHTPTGDIYTAEQLEEFSKQADDGAEARKSLLADMIAMTLPPTEIQMRRVPPRVGRNEPCPCASGKKFKACCLK